VLLTGAAAGNILGKVRPSTDIDFAIRLKNNNQRSWDHVREAIENTVRLTGINANYIDDIDKWGLISLMDYLKHTIPYEKFGRIKVDILAPTYWSIGKMTRYLAPDIQDMVHVFKKQKVFCGDLTRTWAMALRKSPKSAALFQFRKNVEDFLKNYGQKIWSKQFNVGKAILRFHEDAA